MEQWQLQPARDLDLSPRARWRSTRREGGILSAATQLAWWAMVRSYLSCWHRLTIIGRENLPLQPPFVLVANHTSHLDALTLGAIVPRAVQPQTYPIAAGDVFFDSSMAAAFSVSFLNALPMWRRRSAPNALGELRLRLLEQPCAYILFPEGTRSRDGATASFKPGLGMLVAETSVPVVPCYLDGCHRALPPGQRWPRPGRIRAIIGEPLVFAGVPNQRPGWEQIAAIAQERVLSLRPTAADHPRVES